MTNDLTLWESKAELQQIKEIYGKDLSNSEFQTFCKIGQATGLNPFLKEIWAVKYGTNPASIFVARDGYRKSAQRNPNYDYHMSDAVYSNDSFTVYNGEVQHTYNIKDRGILIGGYCIVKRKSSSRPNYVFVELKEYDTGKSLWANKKATMIKKVAEAQCLKMAFQELFSGTYSEDEYDPSENTKQVHHIVAKENISRLIEGKSKKSTLTISGNDLDFQNIMIEIINSTTIEQLNEIGKRIKSLPEEYKEKLREFYQNKRNELAIEINSETGEIIEDKPKINTEFDKVKKQLLSAKSRDTLDVAADLISSCDDLEQKLELSDIYNKRKDEVK